MFFIDVMAMPGVGEIDGPRIIYHPVNVLTLSEEKAISTTDTKVFHNAKK